MDYCERGEVMKWSAKSAVFLPYDSDFNEFMPEVEIKKILRHCVRGLDYRKLGSLMSIIFGVVHRNGIVHRDLKP